MTQLTKGKELDNHVLKLCDELKERNIKAIWEFNNGNVKINMNKNKPKHPVDSEGFPLNDSMGG